MFNITASPEPLLDQALMKADQIFQAAVGSIDDRFGNGYAEQHPELIVGLCNVAITDFQTSINTLVLEGGVRLIAEALERRRR
jgi:hypothetical protein